MMVVHLGDIQKDVVQFHMRLQKINMPLAYNGGTSGLHPERGGSIPSRGTKIKEE